MSARAMARILALAAMSLVFVVPTTAHAEWGMALRAAEEPDEVDWERGATFAWSRTGGETTALVDGVVGWEYSSLKPVVRRGDKLSARQTSGFIGGYWHRDTSTAEPRNDRGASASFGQEYAPNDASGAVWTWGWFGKVKAGKTLKTREVGDAIERYDVSTDRQLVKAMLRFQDVLGGLPSVTRVPPAWLATVDVTGYSDRARGTGVAAIDGRVSGVQAGLTVVVAPLGDPRVVGKPESGTRVYPLFKLAAQVQRDFHASGGRPEETRRLYTGAVDLRFLTAGKGVPGLVLMRTVGADLLTGRPRSSVTELAISLKF